MFKKHKAGFSIRLLLNWNKPAYIRYANSGEVWIGRLSIRFPLPYKENFVYSQGWDEGWRVAMAQKGSLGDVKMKAKACFDKIENGKKNKWPDKDLLDFARNCLHAIYTTEE
jgi:hypothetical protein